MELIDGEEKKNRYIKAYQDPDTGEVFLNREDYWHDSEHLEECVIDIDESLEVVYDTTILPKDERRSE